MMIIELFRYLLRLGRYKRKSVEVGIFRTRVGHFECKFQTQGGIAHQPLLVSENWTDRPFVWYQNIGGAVFGFVTIHASDRQTERQTDGQTELRQQYCLLHCMQSHGKNTIFNRFPMFTQRNSLQD